MKIVGMAALLLALSASAWAQDPCADCRNAAGEEKRKCDAAAKTPAALEKCAKQASEATLACQMGACMPGADAQTAAVNCPDCQDRVADEERRCKAMAPGSAEQAACAQRAARMRTGCEEKFCKPASPK